jgi:hypothetical protein
MIPRRPMGWHGEHGSASCGGHVTTDFLTKDGIVVATEHVYPTDAVYDGKCPSH